MSAAAFASVMTDAVRRPDPVRTVSGHVVGGCNVCGAGIAFPSDRAVTVRCPGCSTPVELRMVAGILSGEACDTSCMYARRETCECSCAGWNHAIGHLVRPLPTWTPVAGAVIPVEYADQSAPAVTGRTRSVGKVTARTERAATARADRERAKADAAAARTADLMTDPDIAALMGDRYADTESGFVIDMRAKVRAGEELTPNMRAAITRTVAGGRRIDASNAARDAARAALVASGLTVTAGRQTIRGTVRGRVKSEEYGPSWATRYRHTVTIVTDEGLRYWGTLPEALEPEWSYDWTPAQKDAFVGWHERVHGQRVTLVATVEPFDDDATGGRFTHPKVPAGTPRLSHIGAADQAPAPVVTPDTARPERRGTRAAAPAQAAAQTPEPAPADTFVSAWAALTL